MKKRIVYLVCGWFWCSAGFAEPAPFGLELGKATLSDVQSKYTLTSDGINKYSQGEMFWLETSELDFEGLQAVLLIFEPDQTLCAVVSQLPKHKFDYLFEKLSSKYQLVEKKVPFVGNKMAKFSDGKSTILLTAPHLSLKWT